MGDATPLSLPAELPYPVTITRVAAAPGDQLRRGDKMLEYTFLSATRRKRLSDAKKSGKESNIKDTGNDMIGTWDCPVDGELESWLEGVEVGAVIDHRRGAKPIATIQQPYLTVSDYLSRPAEAEAGPSRYPGSFEVTHDALGVTVSSKEAKRLDTLTRNNLLANRKLSLIVDLDQTIIHTTVDPTVGKWMDECEEDAKDEQSRDTESAAKDGGKTTTPPGSPPTSSTKTKREKNPNAEALKDVAKFLLPDDLPPGVRSKGPPPMRGYYTKPRPGLDKFLQEQSKLYEMHVYTMGTRTYADAICKIVDPDGSIFGGRILSRDESGSMKAKNLMRLFPTDQSMVVIIDDRSDVWDNSPNLVKVVPYDFFIGIGDINGAFLPPTQPTITAIPGAPTTPSGTSTSSAASSPMPQTPTDIPSQEDGLLRQSKILDEMANSRPLEQLEHENTACDEDSEESGKVSEEVSDQKDEPPSDETETSKLAEEHAHAHHKHHRKALLNPHDDELIRVGDILTHIHTEYYEAYDSRDRSNPELPMSCDAPLIIQEIKDQVLAGCTLTFTGVIPRNIQPEDSDIWRSAEEFGAQCVNDLNNRVTHLVTASIGTEKMHRAAKMSGVQIVWLAWLQASIALWKRAPEHPFLARQDGQSGEPSRPESPKAVDQSTDADTALLRDMANMEEDEEFAKWLEASDDEELSDDGSSDGRSSNGVAENGSGDDPMGGNESSDDEEYHRWSRASTPARSILASRAGSRAPSPGPPRHVRYADEENLPLERVREPRPGEIVSFPPRKKRKLLMLGAPTDDDDVPEANKMVYKAPGFTNGASSSQQDGHDDGGDETDDDDAGSATSGEGDDELAKMLAAELADA